MAQYLLLYHGRQMPRNKIGQIEYIAKLDQWSREISNSVLDGGSPTYDGAKITLGAIKPLQKKPVTSYAILEANSLEEAVELSRGAPPLNEGGSAELYEIVGEED